MKIALLLLQKSQLTIFRHEPTNQQTRPITIPPHLALAVAVLKTADKAVVAQYSFERSLERKAKSFLWRNKQVLDF